MNFFFEALGIKQAQARFTRLGAAAMDLTPAWEEIVLMFNEIEATTFESQGRRGGGSWAQDSEEWLLRKTRQGLDPRINFATGALFAAMTEEDAPGRIVEINPDSLIFGTDLPQAAPSQANRPFVKLTARDRLRMREVIRGHFLRAWAA